MAWKFPLAFWNSRAIELSFLFVCRDAVDLEVKFNLGFSGKNNVKAEA